jgi:hypothetical protein
MDIWEIMNYKPPSLMKQDGENSIKLGKIELMIMQIKIMENS